MAVEFSRASYPLVACTHCSAVLHSCDVDDHEAHICPNAEVPCCNRALGCRELVVRRRMVSHLLTCPASTVSCSTCGNDSQWRSAAPRYKCVFRRDEIARHYEDIHDSVVASRALASQCPWKGYSGCEHTETRMVPFNRDWIVAKGEDDVDIIVPRPSSHDVEPSSPGADHVASASQRARSPGAAASVGGIDGESTSANRPQLYRGLSKEEELAFYGYEKEDIMEEDEYSGAVRVPRQLSQADELALYGYGNVSACDDADDSHLMELTRSLLQDIPLEICYMILEFLDPYSLRQLSMTCHFLRKCCSQLVSKRGLLQLIWEKDPHDSTVWKNTGYRWQFSTFTTFAGKENWRLLPDFLRMADHTREHYRQGTADMMERRDLLSGTSQSWPLLGLCD